MDIRQETSADYPVVYEVIKSAFARAEQKDGNEQDLVAALRQSPSFIPELSLVATIDSKIVGHILYTKVRIGAHTELALAPLSVLPAYQRQGIGQALMAEGHRIAKNLGFHYVIVLGHPAYYAKAGYRPASLYGIQAPFAVADENFMVLKLAPLAPARQGIVQYDPAFGR